MPRSPGLLADDAHELAAREPVVVVVAVEVAPPVVLVDVERAPRTFNERDVGLSTPAEAMVLRRGQERLHGVGEPQTHLAEAGLGVGPPDVAVARPLELTARDEAEPDGHDARDGRDLVVGVGDRGVDIPLVPRLGDEAGDHARALVEGEHENAPLGDAELDEALADPILPRLPFQELLEDFGGVTAVGRDGRFENGLQCL